MKKLVVVLAVAFSGIVFAQPDLDSLNKLPFNVVTCPTTKSDLKSFDLNKIYDLNEFGKLLSERYGCFVECDQFIDINGFTDITIYLRPIESTIFECTIVTVLSIAENLFNRGILVENVNLYYEICNSTSN
jgi:hypothetical protein